MSNCNRIQRLIDEADKPDVLSFAATRHLSACHGCRAFAEERAKLRALLNSMPRVNAPANFDVRLRARLAESKAESRFSWFGPAFVLRFGTAAAAVLITTFVVLYAGNFSSSPVTAGSAAAGNFMIDPSVIRNLPDSTIGGDKEIASHEPAVVAVSGPSHTRAKEGVITPRSVKEFAVDGNPIIILNDDKETYSMPMLPVSVGAQQQMMMRSTHTAAKSLAVSF